jgi:hypothetical protein
MNVRYSKLTRFAERRLFNPADKKDLMELKYFLKHNKWKQGCPFYLEYPWEEIPAMCQHKYSLHMLNQLK